MLEGSIPLHAAADLFPGKPALPTLRRWTKTGLNGIVLSSFKIGKFRYTTHEAVDKFLTQLLESQNQSEPSFRAITTRIKKMHEDLERAYSNKPTRKPS